MPYQNMSPYRNIIITAEIKNFSGTGNVNLRICIVSVLCHGERRFFIKQRVRL